MALRHNEYTSAGAFVAGIDIDSPGQHAAMIEKLNLTFPLLSDPDRTKAIDPYDLADPKDRRNLARIATVVIDPDGKEAWRKVSRDYAERPTEDETLDVVKTMDLSAIHQPPPAEGVPEPGQSAMPFRDLRVYFRGAKFATRALGSRVPEAAEEAAAFDALMDRYMENVVAMHRIMRDRSDGASR